MGRPAGEECVITGYEDNLAATAGEGRSVELPGIQVEERVEDPQDEVAGPVTGELQWRRSLEGLEPVLELPADRPRPRVPGARRRRRTVRVERWSGVDAAVLAAGVAAFFARLTGRRDLPLGTPVAGASGRPGLAVLRFRLDGDPEFRAIVRQARRLLLDATERGPLPGELGAGAAGSHHPIVQVVVAVGSLGGAEADPDALRLDPEAPPFDLVWALDPTTRPSTLVLDHDADRFDATARAFLDGVRVLLEAGLADPSARLGALPLVPPEARRDLLDGWAVTRGAYPRERGMADLFSEQVATRPDAVAVVAGGCAVSYRELGRRADRLAHRLRTLGVRRSVPVVVALEHSLELVEAMVAILRAGGGYVPLDATYPAERLDFMLADVASPVLVTREGLLDRLPVPPGTKVLCVDRAVSEEGLKGAEPAAPPPAPSGADDLAYVTYTSGSTGRPKGVMIPQRGVVRLVRGADYARFGPDETFLHLAAVTFDLTTLEVWGPLLTGGRLVVFRAGAPTPESIAGILARERVTFLWLTAGLFHQMAEARPEGVAPVRQLLAGGDALAAGACRRVLAASPATLLIDGYGPTENTTFSSCHPMRTPGEVTDPVSIGRPVANSSAFVLDPGLEPLPVLAPGELLVGGDGLAWGYWRRPGRTAESFVPQPYPERPGERLYRTGDLARWRPDGTLEFLGRRDHQVKLRGFRIELGEVESVLAEHPGVGEVVVVARELRGDRALVAYLVAPPGAEPPAPRELRAYAAARLPPYMVPAAYVWLAVLPLSPNGKVDRRSLPEPGPADRASAEEYVAPRTRLEQALAMIWSEALGVPRVGLRDDFFALGGHSLLAGSILSRLASHLGVEVGIGALFRARTLEAFAAEVAAAGAGAEMGPVVRVPGDAPVPLSPAQRRLWLLDRLRPGSAVYNLPSVLRIRGALRPATLAAALSEIVRRHETLRTTFVAAGGDEPVQAVRPAGDLPLPVVDLTALPTTSCGPASHALVAAAVRKPFDLAAAPPVRALLVRVSEREHRLLFETHHVVSDGWSEEIVATELRALYPAFLAGAPSPLQDLPVRYSDYAVWQSERLTPELLRREGDHWRRHLAGLPPVLDLPTDRPRPRDLGDRGGEVRVSVEPALLGDLETLAHGEGATAFMALLAGFAAVLGRWSGRDEVAVGSPVAGRPRPELEGLIGFFVNTLVLRCDLRGRPTFRDLLARVREETLGALSHAELPFDRLVEELAPERTTAHHPVVQVLFAGQDLDALAGELAPGVTVEAETVGTGTAKVDLTLFADRRAGALEARFEYSADLFERETIERLAGHLVTLLQSAVAAPDRAVAELPMLSKEERERLLGPWRGRRTGYPREAGLAELFDRQVAARPDAVAIASSGGQLTFAGLDRRARELARRLAVAGVGRGTPVALALERSADLVAAVLGIVRAGGAYVPLDPGYPEERLLFLARDAGARVVVTEEGVLARLGFLAERPDLQVVLLSDGGAPGGGARAAEVAGADGGAGPEDAAYVIYTSGSTGRPKGTVVPQRAVARLVLEADYASFGPDETFLLLAPISFDAATLELWGPLLTGGRLAVQPAGPPTPEGIGEVLARERVTALWLTAGLFHQVVEDAPGAPAPLRRLLAGGDVLDPERCRGVLSTHPGLVLVNGYGPTENTTFTCCHPMASPAEVAAPVPIGRPIADTEVLVVDGALRLQPQGVPGELVAGGDGLAHGYWNRPALTAQRYVPHPWGAAGERLYKTGDRVRWRPDGALEFLGRGDGQVKLRGFRIEVGEVEVALSAHPAVRRAAVVARAASGDGDKVLVGYVVPEGAEAPSPSELRAWLGSRLPPYMVPAAWVALPELPLDPNGKVDRRALPDPGAGALAARREPVAARTPSERAVAAIWAEVLGVEAVGVGDDFFALGGHSLLGARVISRLRARLGVEVSLAQLFSFPALEEFACQVEARTPAAPVSAGPIRRAARRTLVRRPPGEARTGETES